MIILKNLVFILILIYAAYYDYKNRIVLDRIHLMLIGASILANFSLAESIKGFLLLPVPLIIPAFLNEHSMGGGDIKIVSAIGFFLGFEKGSIALLIAFSIVIIINMLMLKKGIKESFPLVPYLTIGCIITLFYN